MGPMISCHRKSLVSLSLPLFFSLSYPDTYENITLYESMLFISIYLLRSLLHFQVASTLLVDLTHYLNSLSTDPPQEKENTP